ncbi:GTPase Era [Oscillatoriales cyanobacterium LEGE 11467]|uniref:GTPase Era n=1 Tax=Zarconia navalis LEGE 11467 TaxID=1828826 RepID=A0A928Z6D1_9CYAN|nr:GTPase Era [Zarconia navalis]MBE9040252.1 GTPase Era [Zarconia navalis LEGE 11467]
MSNLSEIALIPTPPPHYKSGFVGIIGRPNVGKSTLMNQLVGQKVAITSPIAQTTRNRLRGILTTPDAQIIFVDTPGIHKPHHQLGKVLVKNAQIAIHSVDAIVLVVDSATTAGGGDRYIADLLRDLHTPVILGLNKLDLQPADEVAQIDRSYENLGASHWPRIKFSALTGEGTDILQKALVDCLEPGPYYYPPDLVTDQPERFIMGELIREQILLHTRQEVPHSVAIEIDKIEENSDITRIFASIHVERGSQKSIILGKGGSMVKQIGSAARGQMQKLISGKIYLELFVKIQPKWRQSRTRLAQFGYRVED